MSQNQAFSQEEITAMGEAVDQLIALDVGGRKVVRLLYPFVRERYGRPLCLMAAEKLRERVSHGDFVLITCGMLIYPYEDLSETDGPVGGALLARALQMGLGAKPMVLTDQAALPVAGAACRGANLNVTELATVKRTERTMTVRGFPIDEQEARREAKRIFDELKPKAIIAIERRGRNEKGVYHALPKGRNMNHVEAKMVALYDVAKERGVLTIGIGDGANEIGWGDCERRDQGQDTLRRPVCVRLRRRHRRHHAGGRVYPRLRLKLGRLRDHCLSVGPAPET